MTDNEYVQCMIFAGWIDAGTLDSEYQAYLKATHGNQEETYGYDEWQSMTQMAIQDGIEYDEWIVSLDVDPFAWNAPEKLRNEANKRLNALTTNDWYLRY